MRSDSSSPSHAGFDEIGIPVSIASAAAAGQPSLATIAGLRNDDPRGGALPPSMERSIASLLHAMRMNSIAQSAFLEYFDIAMNWPSTMVRLCAFAVCPGIVAQAQRPPVWDSFGSLNSVPYDEKVTDIAYRSFCAPAMISSNSQVIASGGTTLSFNARSA